MAMEATNIAAEAAGPFKELLSNEFVSKMEEKVSSFAENIPQSLCTRYGLYFGAKMAGLVRVLMWTLVSIYTIVLCQVLNPFRRE